MEDNQEPKHAVFFISYAGVDVAWAEWIAWQLEAAGHKTILHAWDFRAGTHFVDKMHRATQGTRTIAVLSRAYLDSAFAAEEWQAAWASDPAGQAGRLLVVRVEECDRPGLLRQLVSVDVFGITPEVAKERLLAAAAGLRAKPSAEPRFPAPRVNGGSLPAFPGVPAVWNVPGRLETFTGRATLLRRIHRALNRPNHDSQRGPAVAITALRGLGGVGKTQLAIEYTWRHAADYSLAWWIDAEQSSLLADKLASLARRLGIPVTGQVTEDATAALDQLASMDRWLVIFDNATSLDAIQRWLPSGPGHVLITSRHPAWRAIAARVDIDILSRHEAMSFLRKRIPHVTRDVADELSAELGDLPLALAQAAAYLELTEMDPQSYLQRVRSQREKMIFKGKDLVYGGNLETVWSLALERLMVESPATLRLLEHAAFLGPEPIPLHVFTNSSGQLADPLSETADDEGPALDIDDVVAAAQRYSLCRRRDDAIQLHRLVQAVIRAHLPAERHAHLLESASRLLAAAHPGHPDDPATWPAWSALGPHILYLRATIGSHDSQLDDLADDFC